MAADTTTMKSLDDLCDLEQRFTEEGKAAGYERGFAHGTAEGRRLGIKHGSGVGHEVGFYAGTVKGLRSMLNGGVCTLSARALTNLTRLEEMVEQFPVEDAVNEELFEQLDAMRAKFKQLMSLTGLNITYEAEMVFPSHREQAQSEGVRVAPELSF